MDASFWHDKWERGQIGFHQPHANPLLLRNWPQMPVTPGQRVFLPLCGKSLDLAWLLSEGYEVVGAELSELAIAQLFEELGVVAEVTDVSDQAVAGAAVKLWQADGLKIFVGDIFALTAEMIGPVDAIYDRAALVALPEAMRQQYARHLIDLTAGVPQLLICFVYDQSQMSGPPFSVTTSEVHEHYHHVYQLNLLDNFDVPGGMNGQIPAVENVWQLLPQITRRE
ncbi:thiopurine S-methyltransferase [Oceanobacter mangrovi]|uniref:thiopurine S-methyltransferase n=1 Tax=Oceanobacter mangrovi TaxID=2862510 RepID=UPI001C8D8A8F|nr:thiopurine S-methyltransferase [Oceanobacter mangrovi]